LQNLSVGLDETAAVGNYYLKKLVNISKIYALFKVNMGAASTDTKWDY
jgi:hypothetical protein